jgi:hypothetical protein
VEPDELPETAFILQGPILKVRWMRFDHAFPARRFLEQYPEDFAQFLQRCREMADYGRIRLRNNGHQLHGEFAALHQFNLKLTRSWGVRDGDVYLVLDADTKKNDKKQQADYRRALLKYQDYLNGPSND